MKYIMMKSLRERERDIGIDGKRKKKKNGAKVISKENISRQKCSLELYLSFI